MAKGGAFRSDAGQLPALQLLAEANSKRDPEEPFAWWQYAACKGMEAANEEDDIFFPERGEREKVVAAKEVCASCPVRLPCLIDGLREPYGVWGGFTVDERVGIKKKVRKARSPQPISEPTSITRARGGRGSKPGSKPAAVGHRFTGAPNAWCIDCGAYDREEFCAHHHPEHSASRGVPKSCRNEACPEPGSARHDPYARKRPRQRAEERRSKPRKSRSKKNGEEDEWAFAAR